MLNLKNKEIDAVFDEICKKTKNKKQKTKIKISKNERYFFGQHPWLKSHHPPLFLTIYFYFFIVALYNVRIKRLPKVYFWKCHSNTCLIL